MLLHLQRAMASYLAVSSTSVRRFLRAAAAVTGLVACGALLWVIPPAEWFRPGWGRTDPVLTWPAASIDSCTVVRVSILPSSDRIPGETATSTRPVWSCREDPDGGLDVALALRSAPLYRTPVDALVRLEAESATGAVLADTTLHLAALTGIPPEPIHSLSSLGSLESQLCGVLAGFALAVAMMLLERRGANVQRHGYRDAHLYRGAIGVFVLACTLGILAASLALILGSDPDEMSRGRLLHAAVAHNFGFATIALFYGIYLCLLASNQDVEYQTAHAMFWLAVLIASAFVSYTTIVEGMYSSNLSAASWLHSAGLFPATIVPLATLRYWYLWREHVALHDQVRGLPAGPLWNRVQQALRGNPSRPLARLYGLLGRLRDNKNLRWIRFETSERQKLSWIAQAAIDAIRIEGPTRWRQTPEGVCRQRFWSEFRALHSAALKDPKRLREPRISTGVVLAFTPAIALLGTMLYNRNLLDPRDIGGTLYCLIVGALWIAFAWLAQHSVWTTYRLFYGPYHLRDEDTLPPPDSPRYREFLSHSREFLIRLQAAIGVCAFVGGVSSLLGFMLWICGPDLLIAASDTGRLVPFTVVVFFGIALSGLLGGVARPAFRKRPGFDVPLHYRREIRNAAGVLVDRYSVVCWLNHEAEPGDEYFVMLRNAETTRRAAARGQGAGTIAAVGGEQTDEEYMRAHKRKFDNPESWITELHVVVEGDDGEKGGTSEPVRGEVGLWHYRVDDWEFAVLHEWGAPWYRLATNTPLELRLVFFDREGDSFFWGSPLCSEPPEATMKLVG